MEEEINNQIQQEGVDTNKISDGYHTFGELYEHRIALFIAYCNGAAKYTDGLVWKSKKHSDGSEWDGWFIAGIFKKKGDQITYHLPIDKWDKLRVEELKAAPPYDGHTSDDVIERIYKLLDTHA